MYFGGKKYFRTIYFVPVYITQHTTCIHSELEINIDTIYFGNITEETIYLENMTKLKWWSNVGPNFAPP